MWTVMDSPVGQLRIVANQDALTAIDFEPFDQVDGLPRGDRDDAHPLLVAAVRQLGEYFAKQRRDFELPLDPDGTEFQRKVWRELACVGFGETASYGEIAKRLGMAPGASRAVGLANGKNPIPIVVPCHRIIGANGSLTGYAGGLERKQVLLGLEEDALF